jgi:DNA-binding response OmpR family regulator
MPGETLLAITADPGLGEHLRGELVARGRVVAVAQHPSRALDVLDQVTPDAVLFDLAVDRGWDLCRQLITRHPFLSVVVIAPPNRAATARAQFQDHRVRVVCADSMALLATRVDQMLTQTIGGFLVDGDVEVDRESRRAWIGGIEVTLRVKEFDLLVCLMANAGRALTRDQLMAEVWQDDWTGSTKTLDVHIAMLRRRLGEAPGDPSRISTIRGVGYRYESYVLA